MHPLEFLQQVTGNSKQQAIAVVQPAGYENLDHHLSSVFCDGSDDRSQLSKLVIYGPAQRRHMVCHRQPAVDDDSEDLRGINTIHSFRNSV